MVYYCKARANVHERFVKVVVRRASGGVNARGSEGSNLLLDAVTLDVVTLVSDGVILGVDVARGSAPHVLEASVVGRVAIRGSRRALR